MQATFRRPILPVPMRTALTILAAVAALAAPTAAIAVSRSSDDGTLAVRDATGRVRIAAVGGFIGRLDKGRVTIVDPIEGDGTGPLVNGCEFRKVVFDPETGGTTAVCAGTKLRFRLVGGKFNVIIRGAGLDLSVVGHGTVMLDGAGGDDGRYSFNGADFQSIPDTQRIFTLAAPSTGP